MNGFWKVALGIGTIVAAPIVGGVIVAGGAYAGAGAIITGLATEAMACEAIGAAAATGHVAAMGIGEELVRRGARDIVNNS